jgi:hypothetical protein
MGEDPANWGTEADLSPASEYCQFCYQGGGFTKPDQTVDDMVQSSIDFMTSELGFERERASEMSNAVIRSLRRWN